MNCYLSLRPGTLEIVDRFQGNQSHADSRSSSLEHIIVPPSIKSNYVILSRNPETNEIEFSEDAEAMERDRLSAIQSSWDKLRNVRNIHISNTDWVMLSDISMTTEKKEEWETYRQALREVPSKTSDPTNVTWPTPPS
tara:strand:- start:2715 stop:3128 length:414 start_codon:yes stop_codon:yes gene_type:complete